MKSQKFTIAELVAPVVGLPTVEIAGLVEYPPNPDLGDLALPCFRFAKQLRKAPTEIAKEVAAVLTESGNFKDVAVAGGYVNVYVAQGAVAKEVVGALRTEPQNLFAEKRLIGDSAAIDYSSPNIAKPFGVGHLRSTMIGHAIANLLREDGSRVIGINHLGDWGTQFGKNIAAYRMWGDEETVRKNPTRELLELYVRFHAEAEKHPALDDEARAWFKRLEDGDEEARSLWQWFIDESLKAFQATYDRLGVHHEQVLGESFYNDKMDAVVEELKEKGLLTESEGAEVVDLSAYDLPPCIIRKSDGATIYATRDLAAALYRHDVLGGNRLIYVVGAEQTLHFQQVFKVLELMGREWAKDCRHVAFGMMKYNGERLSTRRGKVVYLEDVLEKAVAEARRIIDEKNPELPNKDDVAEAIGIGAVVFNDLKNYRMHDVDFRYEDVLNFDGETGPYVQYTHARACSVLRKAGVKDNFDSSSASDVVLQPSEWRLIVEMNKANEMFERAIDQLDPSLIARLVLDVCHAFNRFYHDVPILGADTESEKEFRLELTDASRRFIAYCLNLLGLRAPEAM
ncbi:arginine--tRNA ligase [Alicyclobacillus ferrooxydans]|uniref:Arginine--tRNA ligase n=1 Tax=Alicyclobacillus ferrooxydans TaxID=471514 RepID=A0A0P9CRI3_9BACL|nr:arginine--tRNA ligase [Alicyclobacillus ferrooxydans]KPV45449.1 arginine--tRNA ligase [Alicyclobacillus ferrooxydans]